jgi:hypothetical protein
MQLVAGDVQVLRDGRFKPSRCSHTISSRASCARRRLCSRWREQVDISVLTLHPLYPLRSSPVGCSRTPADRGLRGGRAAGGGGGGGGSAGGQPLPNQKHASLAHSHSAARSCTCRIPCPMPHAPCHSPSHQVPDPSIMSPPGRPWTRHQQQDTIPSRYSSASGVPRAGGRGVLVVPQKHGPLFAGGSMEVPGTSISLFQARLNPQPATRLPHGDAILPATTSWVGGIHMPGTATLVSSPEG